MLTRTGLRSLVRPLSAATTQAKRGVTSKPAFAFLPANALPSKPRGKGLTEIRGPYYYPVTATYLEELLSDWGAYVDGIKFAGGAFSLMPEERLKPLIDVAHEHGALIAFSLMNPSHLRDRLLCLDWRFHRACSVNLRWITAGHLEVLDHLQEYGL